MGSISDSWIRGGCIGNGAFGSVNVAVDRVSGRVFAVKSVNTSTSNRRCVRSLENEIEILKSLHSSYIVSYLGDDITVENSTGIFRNLHMEFMPGGTVCEATKKGFNTEINYRNLQRYTKCITAGLHYLHSNGVVHGDIKGKNVLIGSNQNIVKLADFGSARNISSEKDCAEICGTPLWMAPEVIRGEPPAPASDVWSLGCTVIEMATGNSPNYGFSIDDDPVSAVYRIGFENRLPQFPSNLSKSCRDFLEKCLNREPSERWTCEQLLSHPFIIETHIEQIEEEETELTPRSVLDRFSLGFSSEDDETEEKSQFENFFPSNCSGVKSVRDRIGKLASGSGIEWGNSEDWEVVRTSDPCFSTPSTCNNGESVHREEIVEITRTFEFTSLKHKSRHCRVRSLENQESHLDFFGHLRFSFKDTILRLYNKIIFIYIASSLCLGSSMYSSSNHWTRTQYSSHFPHSLI